MVPTNMAQEIYDVATSEKVLWIVEDAGHTNSYENVTLAFEQQIHNFLDSTIT